MIPSRSIAVLYHVFYEDIMDNILNELSPLKPYQPYYFFNINAETPNAFRIKAFLSMHFPDCVITISSNRGKDIGGKLILLNICLQLGIHPDWFVFLHDKKSLHALNSKTWKSDLLTIISPTSLDKIETLVNQKDCGIIAANNYVHRESRGDGKFISTNGMILEDLIQQYKLEPKSFQYVAGTMFWARAKPMMDFFSAFDPLQIRFTLEEGNVIDNYKGSHTHSWERLLSWIITSKGLEIKTT